jgi:hypothetical protein
MTIGGGRAAAALAAMPDRPLALAAMPDRPLALAALGAWLFTVSLGAFMLARWIRRGDLRRPPGPAGRRHRGDPGLPPAVIFSHLGLAVTGLLVWASFVLDGWDALGWAAAALLFPAIGLGICTVTLWTPYPAYPAGAGSSSAAAPGTAPGSGGTRAGDARNRVTGPAGGMLASPAENALAARLNNDILARALTDEALASRLTEEVLASIPPGIPRRGRRTPLGHMAPLIPVAHGMGATTTFLLVILAAIGAR